MFGYLHVRQYRLIYWYEFMTKQTIGFIGQGFIGRHMADDFEERGYLTIRYALEEPYVTNRDRIKLCPITFIAVPTPTTPNGFDAATLRQALALIGGGNVAVIKSTILPGTTMKLQEEFPHIMILHSPEFLRENSAAEDTANPQRNIIGIPLDNDHYREKAETVMQLLPSAPYTLITSAVNAESIKYVGNTFLYTKLVFMNLAHDFTVAAGGDWETVRNAVAQDARIGYSHTDVEHSTGRGAGGHCLIKDFEAFIEQYEASTSDTLGLNTLKALRNKNNQLLTDSQKDLDLLHGVYGEDVIT